MDNINTEQYAFSAFDPKNLAAFDGIPLSPGNYIIVLKNNCKLPDIGIEPVYKTFNGYNVVYTGLSSSAKNGRLKNRLNCHFIGNNAGRSTLRKSIGCLFGYELIPRDSKPNGKTKFSDTDEEMLSEWMCENLLVFYCVTKEYESMEDYLITKYNPPINIEKTDGIIENHKFREKLKSLRRG